MAGGTEISHYEDLSQAGFVPLDCFLVAAHDEEVIHICDDDHSRCGIVIYGRVRRYLSEVKGFQGLLQLLLPLPRSLFESIERFDQFADLLG